MPHPSWPWLIAAMALAVLGLSLREDEEKRIQNKFVEWSRWTAGTGERVVSRHVAFTRAVARGALAALDLVFGPKLLNFRMLWSSVMVANAGRLLSHVTNFAVEYVYWPIVRPIALQGMKNLAWYSFSRVFGFLVLAAIPSLVHIKMRVLRASWRARIRYLGIVLCHRSSLVIACLLSLSFPAMVTLIWMDSVMIVPQHGWDRWDQLMFARLVGSYAIVITSTYLLVGLARHVLQLTEKTNNVGLFLLGAFVFVPPTIVWGALTVIAWDFDDKVPPTETSMMAYSLFSMSEVVLLFSFGVAVFLAVLAVNIVTWPLLSRLLNGIHLRVPVIKVIFWAAGLCAAASLSSLSSAISKGLGGSPTQPTHDSTPATPSSPPH